MPWIGESGRTDGRPPGGGRPEPLHHQAEGGVAHLDGGAFPLQAVGVARIVEREESVVSMSVLAATPEGVLKILGNRVAVGS